MCSTPITTCPTCSSDDLLAPLGEATKLRFCLACLTRECAEDEATWTPLPDDGYPG